MDAARANNRTFEEYDPAVEWSRTGDADTVKISLPGKPSVDHAWRSR